MKSIRFVGALVFVVVASASHMPGMAADAAAKAAPAVVHTVTVEGTAFTPADLTVKVGETITWINKDPYPHTATSQTGAFDSGSIGPDKSWKYVVRKTGEFPYLCTIHPSMKGVIRVK
ncbi:MAG: cupredoxin family copper-binding protein [Vicinamibacterales bacterium]